MAARKVGGVTIRGIPVTVDGSWVVMLLLITWSLAQTTYPQLHPDWPSVLTWGISVLTSLLFMASVLVHEVAHSLVALSRGLPVRSIRLYIFGGVSEMEDEPPSPLTEFLVSLAGPAASIALGGFLYLAAWAARSWVPSVSAIDAMFRILGRISISLGLFNLVPGFPLDGGRALRAGLWALRKDLTWATRWAARVGRSIALVFSVLGIVTVFSGDWVNGVWLVFLGVFLDNAARASVGRVTLQNLLAGHVVGEIMSEGCHLVPPQLTLDVFVEQYLMAEGQRCYPVGQSGDVVGLVTLHNIRSIPRSRWRETRVREAMTAYDDLQTVTPDTPLWDALKDMTQEGVNQLPVVIDGQLVGMVSRENLISFLHARSVVEV